jgi:plasmid stabilization system protein ParE
VKITVSPAALADIKRLHAFLVGRNPTAANRVVGVIDAAVLSLDIFPDRGRPSDIPDVRELVVPFGRSAYVLRYAYRPQSDEIVILRIWHGREQRE